MTSNEREDYPLPPHYYKLFEKTGAVEPPSLQKIAEKNKVFYAFGAEESFWDNGEKITPYYLEGKKVMLT